METEVHASLTQILLLHAPHYCNVQFYQSKKRATENDCTATRLTVLIQITFCNYLCNTGNNFLARASGVIWPHRMFHTSVSFT